MEAWLVKLEEVAAEVVQREGCVLYDLEFVGSGQGRILRVYVDKDTGVGIEDCSNVSKAINLRLDVEDLVPGGPYNLEVSTPGLDRHLKKKWHFEKVKGKKIFIKLSRSLAALGVEDKGIMSTKQFEEVLEDVQDDSLIFNLRKVSIKVPIEAIDKARLVFVMKTNPKKK